MTGPGLSYHTLEVKTGNNGNKQEKRDFPGLIYV